MNPAQFWALEMQNQQNQQAQMQQMTQQVFNSASQLAGMYAENKAMGVKAKSYDKIADVLGTAMFSNNPDAMSMFKQIKSAEDPREKVMGYETLFSLLGPMSNMMMAQGRFGLQQGQQDLTARGQNITVNMPAYRAQAAAQAKVASGQGTINAQSIGYNPNVLPRRRNNQTGP